MMGKHHENHDARSKFSGGFNQNFRGREICSKSASKPHDSTCDENSF